MGQSRLYKRRSSTDTIEVQTRIGRESGAEGARINRDCIQFLLQDCTLLVETLRVGEPIFGDFALPRVAILDSRGVIGYAPTDVSVELLRRAKLKNRDISGTVTLLRGSRLVEVEVCI